jgi:hypothetical protein
MKKNHLTFTGAMIASALFGALVTSWFGSPPQAVAQDAEKPAPAPAVYAPPGVSLPVQRYAVEALGDRYFVVLDTRTGRCWTGSTHGNTLSQLGPPPGAEK